MAGDAHLFDNIPLGKEALKRKVDALTLELREAESQLASSGGDGC